MKLLSVGTPTSLEELWRKMKLKKANQNIRGRNIKICPLNLKCMHSLSGRCLNRKKLLHVVNNVSI